MDVHITPKLLIVENTIILLIPSKCVVYVAVEAQVWHLWIIKNISNAKYFGNTVHTIYII